MKKTFFYQTSLKPIEKICLCGLFIALAMVLNKVLAINYIPIIPFLRISLGGPAIIILSSLLLGPIYGMFVGGLSDIFGYIIFDIKSFPYMPPITLTYILLGFLPAFLFALVQHIKNKKAMLLSEIVPMVAIIAFVSIYLGCNSSLTLYGTTYQINLWMKIVIPIVLLALFALIIVFTVLVDKKMMKMILDEDERNKILNPYQISFVCFIVELIVMLLFGSWMKSIAFGYNMFMAIFVCQIITMFVNIPLNVSIISCVLIVGRKHFLADRKK